MKKSILKYLYNKNEEVFYKLVDTSGKQIKINETIDMSSNYGIYKFGVLPIDDPVLEKAFEKSVDRLSVKTDIGGIARFEGDSYHHKGGNYPGNPWIITSMWLAQYYISKAKSEKDMKEVKRLFSWVVSRANPAGILAEQYDPDTGEQISAAPLVWSHAEFVIAVILYLKKLEELGVCKACYPVD